MKKKSILFLTTIFGSLSFLGQADSNLKEQETMNANQVKSVIEQLFAGVDKHNWNAVSSAMLPEVYADYSSITGVKGSKVLSSELISDWRKILPGFQSTHHQTGNFEIAFNEEEAAASFNGVALHYLPYNGKEDYWSVTGTYDFRLVQLAPQDWRISSLKFNLIKIAGNSELPLLAAQNVKTGQVFQKQPVSLELKTLIENFFGSLQSRNIESFMSVWKEDGSQIMPFAPDGFPTILNGSIAILNQYKGLPDNFISMEFPYRIFPTEKSNVAIVQYNGFIELKDGGYYNNIYVGIFEMEHGKLKAFTEFFDPTILEQSFGTKLNSNFNISARNTSIRKVEFLSEGLILRGNLHLPANFNESNQYKAVLVTGSWTTVKEQMADLYSKMLADKGYVALSFDFRNYGESEGQPRNYESPEMKVVDIINASEYLRNLEFIDQENIGGLAICASAGYMSSSIAQGAKLKTATLVAPWLHNADIVRSIYGGETGVEAKILKSEASRKQFVENGLVDIVPAVSTSDTNAAMFGNFDYYLNPERGAIKSWANEFAVMSWKGWLEFDPISVAKLIDTPIQIIHSQSAAVPQGASQFYADLGGVKQMLWLEGASQFDFYDNQLFTSQAISEAAKWFNEHLK